MTVPAEQIHALDAVNAGVMDALDRLKVVASAYQDLRYGGQLDELADENVQRWLRDELRRGLEGVAYATQRWDGAFN